jgi:hypothetical protein
LIFRARGGGARIGLERARSGIFPIPKQRRDAAGRKKLVGRSEKPVVLLESASVQQPLSQAHLFKRK